MPDYKSFAIPFQTFSRLVSDAQWLAASLALSTDRGATLGEVLGEIEPSAVATPALVEACCYVAAAAPLMGLTKEATKAAIEADEGAMAAIDAILMQ